MDADKNPVLCGACGEAFSDEADLIHHEEEHHKSKQLCFEHLGSENMKQEPQYPGDCWKESDFFSLFTNSENFGVKNEVQESKAENLTPNSTPFDKNCRFERCHEQSDLTQDDLDLFTLFLNPENYVSESEPQPLRWKINQTSVKGCTTTSKMQNQCIGN